MRELAGSPQVEVLRHGSHRLRVAPWHGDARVALVSPFPGDAAPTAAAVRAWLDELAARGVDSVVTAALGLAEQQPFLCNGMTQREHLHLLAHDLAQLPSARPIGPTLRRARRHDLAAIDAVDREAFDGFWHLGPDGLGEALAATPSSWLRVAAPPAGPLAGYAVFGRAGARGYLQRLAVSPQAQGHGVGRALTLAGLRWLRRHGVERVLVNTQHGNAAALHLYRSVGFVEEPHGLAVLGASLR